MKRLLSISALLLCSAFAHAQLSFVYPNTTESLNGTTIEVPTQDNVSDEEVLLWVLNESETTYSVKCRRTELSVLPGTENNVCWYICPNTNQVAGENPVWVVGFGTTELTENSAPGSTIQSFSFHYLPENLDGCSKFKVELFNADDPTETLATFDILFNHTENCFTSVAELTALDFSMAPNPANDRVALTLDTYKGSYKVEVSDVLGQVVYRQQMNAALSNKMSIPTAGLNSGMYFLSITDGTKTLKTSKLLVKH